MTTLIFLFVMYILPTIIALARNHKDTVLISVINILMGWTIVFWVFAFVLSLTNPQTKDNPSVIIVNNRDKE